MIKNTLILISLLSTGLLAEVDSAYTSLKLKDCKSLSSHSMGGSFSCEKYGDIKVELSEGDIRQSITLVRKGILYPLDLPSSVSPAFSVVGDTIEWRFNKKSPKQPFAMINRFTTETGERSEISTSYLVVSKITENKICVVGKIKPQKNQNVLARAMADKAKTMSCIFKSKVEEVLAPKKHFLNLEKLKKIALNNPKADRYMRDMGPIEHTLRVLKKPNFPVWRIRLRLYVLASERFPSLTGGYRVVVDRINLSPLLYNELSQANGKENVDPSLNNHNASDRHVLNYMVIQNNPSMFIEEEIEYMTITIPNEKLSDDEGDWGSTKGIKLIASPWEFSLNPTASMARILAKKSGWMSDGRWHSREKVEGATDKTALSEIVIENYVGNGGSLLVEWRDLVSDDSIDQTLYRLNYDESQKDKALFQQAVICGRGEVLDKPSQMCI